MAVRDYGYSQVFELPATVNIIDVPEYWIDYQDTDYAECLQEELELQF